MQDQYQLKRLMRDRFYVRRDQGVHIQGPDTAIDIIVREITGSAKKRKVNFEIRGIEGMPSLQWNFDPSYYHKLQEGIEFSVNSIKRGK